MSRWLLVVGMVLKASPLLAADPVAPEPILLWPGGAPGALGDEPADRPEVRIYPAPRETTTGAMVVVCPGGGYRVLAIDHEGQQIARWLNTIGVSAAVVKYRLGPRYHHPAPLQDAQRAIRYVRANARDLGIDPQRVGVMGFSAGGHLASTVSTHFDAGDPRSGDPRSGDPRSGDPIARESCRPDFAILCYPVISLKSSFTHKGSLANLLGEDPDPALVESLSNETQVTSQTPPTFLFHTSEDRGVPVQNSLVYYRALVEQGVPAELHVYQQGPHGVGLAPGNPVLSTWKERLADWLKVNGFLKPRPMARVSGKVILDGEPLRWGTIGLFPDDPLARPSWGMVSRGLYSLEAVTGLHNVVIWTMGAVDVEPTIVDASSPTGPPQQTSVRFDVVPTENTFDLDLQSGAK